MELTPSHSEFVIAYEMMCVWEYLNYGTSPSILLYNVSPSDAETLRLAGVTLYKDDRSIRDIVPAHVRTTIPAEEHYYDLPQLGFSKPVRCVTFAPWDSFESWSSPALLEVVSYKTDEGILLPTQRVYVCGKLPDLDLSTLNSSTITKE